VAPAEISLQLSVSDLGTTEAFYAGLLGLPVQRPVTSVGAPEHLVLKSDGCELIFVEDAALLQAHPILEPRLENYPRGIGITLHLKVEGLQGIYQALLDEELEILYPLEWKPYGVFELWCFDPDGYLVVLEEAAR
jgi:hypothetical protein